MCSFKKKWACSDKAVMNDNESEPCPYPYGGKRL